MYCYQTYISFHTMGMNSKSMKDILCVSYPRFTVNRSTIILTESSLSVPLEKRTSRGAAALGKVRIHNTNSSNLHDTILTGSRGATALGKVRIHNTNSSNLHDTILTGSRGATALGKNTKYQQLKPA